MIMVAWCKRRSNALLEKKEGKKERERGKCGNVTSNKPSEKQSVFVANYSRHVYEITAGW